MSPRTAVPWLNYALGALCLAAILAAVLVLGPSASSQTGVTRTAKVAEGVVQSTVSGSGNLQPASQLNLGFKTAGTVTAIYVKQGQYVTQGKLLATLDPQSAEVTLEQAKAALLSAEASLAREQETDGEASSGSAGSGSASASGSSSPAVASAASASPTSSVSDRTPSSTAPQQGAQPEGAAEHSSEAQAKNKHTKASRESKRTSSATTKPAESTTTPAKSTLSAATREANIASARANVKSDSLTVQNDEQAVANTKMYAPEDGTIVSLSGQVGEVVSASGITRNTGSSGSSNASGSASGASAASRSGASAGAGSSASGSSGSGSSTAFALLSDLSSMQLIVALSESEIGHVKVGQIATVSVEALEGRKLAAHVSEVATLSTSSSGAVSYDVTFSLDQMEAGLKPGMSATAEVVVKQEEGVNVPSSAIKGGSVTVARNGKDETRRVTTGLAGDSSTIVLSGLKAGETVVLPTALSTSSATSLTSRLGRLGAGGGLGAGLGGGGAIPAAGGGPAFFRGGG